MSRLKKFWQLINAPPINQGKDDIQAGDLQQIFWRFFLRPFCGSIIVIIILSSLVGSVSRFFYAWTGQFVADDIVQVQLQARDVPAAAKLDPTLTDENRLFALDDPHQRTSLSTRLENSPGRSVSEKLRLSAILAILLAAMLIFDHVLAWILNVRVVYVSQKVQYHLRHRIYEKFQSLPMSYHDEYAVGRQMTNLFSDVTTIADCTMVMLKSMRDVVTFILGLIIIFSIDAFLAGLVLLALPLYGISYSWFHGRLKTVHRNLRQREGKLNAHISNRITNFYLVKSFVREASEAIDFLRRTRPIVRDTLAGAVLGSCFNIFCGVISGGTMVAVVWLGALRVRDGQMTLGTLLLFYTSTGFMFTPVMVLSHFIGILHRLRTVSSKVIRVLDEPVTMADPDQGLPVPVGAPEITFENVTLRYQPDRPAALENLSFTLPAGRTVCIMGASGSGKSTLSKLACRMYDPSEGSIKLDGCDIRNFRISHLRKITGYLSQEPVIFDGTINENIRYGSENSDHNEIISAAQYAQIHEFIWQLPSKYQTSTCQRGLTLSGGQKQRVNLARVLLFDPKLLVLDDCTSALDAETEAKLIHGFDTALRDRTVILVSHRISMALRCDYVMILDQGKMVEFGSPEKLLDQDGMFKGLVDEQIGKAKFLKI